MNRNFESRHSKSTFLAAMVLLSLALVLAGCSDSNTSKPVASGESSGTTEAQASVPHWSDSVKSVDAAAVNQMIADNKGKAVMLVIWSVNCPACTDELPVVEELAGEYTEDEMVFMLLNLDDMATMKSYFQDYVPNAQVFLAEDDVTSEFRAMYIPKLVLFNGKGEISFEDSGFYPKRMLSALIDRAIVE